MTEITAEAINKKNRVGAGEFSKGLDCVAKRTIMNLSITDINQEYEILSIHEDYSDIPAPVRITADAIMPARNNAKVGDLVDRNCKLCTK
jgi:hypothetical protein